MPLRNKLLVYLLIPALLVIAMGITGVLSLRYLEQASQRILADNYHTIQEAQRMEQALVRLEHRMLMGRVPPERAKVAGPVPTLVDSLEAGLARCEGNVTEPGEQDILRRIRASWTAHRSDWQRLETLPPGAAHDRLAQSAEALHENITALVALNEQAMFALKEDSRRTAQLMVLGVGGALAACLFALLVFAFAAADRVARPVVNVADRLHRALNPKGHDTAVPLRGVDEIHRLRQELDALLARLGQYEDEQTRELRRVQERLAMVMNEVHEGMVLLDASRRILAANRVGRVLLAMPEGDGQRLEDLHPREDVRDMLAPVLRGAVKPEQDLGEVRFPIDGEPRVYRPRVMTATGADGDVEGVLILFWDVTDQQRFEEARQRFISMLSHQLKTPMTSLSMAVNLLREKYEAKAPEDTELLAIATESCTSLSTLVTDIIQAAREVTPDLTLRPTTIDLVRLLRSALRPLQPQAEEKRVRLIVPDASLRVVARVDPVKFPWVVINIAGNALRYTPPGGTIQVAVERQGAETLVRVSDSGTGIATKDLMTIFEPYVSLDIEPHPGTHGLGLAIAKEIVEAHGGAITANSEPGKGTTFQIRLPSNHGANP